MDMAQMHPATRRRLNSVLGSLPVCLHLSSSGRGLLLWPLAGLTGDVQRPVLLEIVHPFLGFVPPASWP